eukprot:TRINITY_DN4882_c0_g1_i2.p1 TRINITY_DN4882_c0_g1~~TRINITY_DN4882_c0_g1_i2.p1  ORF type:complete len:259 (+),score=13.08 TRINITY_DN4882_c0_g1_i2:285-1061(+)
MRSGLSLTQTKQWFVNARRRLLPNVLQQTQTPPKRQPKLTQRLADIGGNVDSAILALPAPPAVSTLDLALPRSDLVVVPELGQGLVRRAYYRHAVVAVNISRNDKDKENLRREAELMCTLRHRNVVNTIGFCDGILITELSELGDCQLPDDAFFGRLGYDAKSLGDSCEMQVCVLASRTIHAHTRVTHSSSPGCEHPQSHATHTHPHSHTHPFPWPRGVHEFGLIVDFSPDGDVCVCNVPASCVETRTVHPVGPEAPL